MLLAAADDDAFGLLFVSGAISEVDVATHIIALNALKHRIDKAWVGILERCIFLELVDARRQVRLVLDLLGIVICEGRSAHLAAHVSLLDDLLDGLRVLLALLLLVVGPHVVETFLVDQGLFHGVLDRVDVRHVHH